MQPSLSAMTLYVRSALRLQKEVFVYVVLFSTIALGTIAQNNRIFWNLIERT